MKKNIYVIVCLLSTIFIATLSYAIEYEPIDLGTFGGTYARANAVNNNGQIVGQFTGSDGKAYSFLWESGSVVDTFLGIARDINDSGQIVGSMLGGGAFLYDNGSITNLPFNDAYAINNNSQIVGNDSTNAVLYENGTITNLPFDSAFDINDNGQVIGRTWPEPHNQNPYHAVIYDDGNLTDIHSSSSYLYSWPKAINYDGDVVGFYSDNTSSLAFIYDNGTTTYIPAIEAIDINDNSEVVGRFRTSDPAYGITGVTRAFVYYNGILTDLGEPGSGYSEAMSLNNQGQIVGWADSCFNCNDYHAVLWNPVAVVPEPISSVLFIFGGLLLAGRRYIGQKQDNLMHWNA